MIENDEVRSHRFQQLAPVAGQAVQLALLAEPAVAHHMGEAEGAREGQRPRPALRRLANPHARRGEQLDGQRRVVPQHDDDAVAFSRQTQRQRDQLHQVPEPAAKFPCEEDCCHGILASSGR